MGHPLMPSSASELQRHAESRAEVILLSFREKQRLAEQRLAEQQGQAQAEAIVPSQEPVDGDHSGRRSDRPQVQSWTYEQRPCEQKTVRYVQDGEQARRSFGQTRGGRSPGVLSTTRCRQEYESA